MSEKALVLRKPIKSEERAVMRRKIGGIVIAGAVVFVEKINVSGTTIIKLCHLKRLCLTLTTVRRS